MNKIPTKNRYLKLQKCRGFISACVPIQRDFLFRLEFLMMQRIDFI